SSCNVIGAIIVCGWRHSPNAPTIRNRANHLSGTQRMHPDHSILRAGQPAPLFSLPDADMESVDLAQYRNRNHVVLYFYPRDGTPGCTLQATDFSDHEEEFTRHDCVVLGV